MEKTNETNERCVRRIHDWVRACVDKDIASLRRRLRQGRILVRSRTDTGGRGGQTWTSQGATERGSHA